MMEIELYSTKGSGLDNPWDWKAIDTTISDKRRLSGKTIPTNTQFDRYVTIVVPFPPLRLPIRQQPLLPQRHVDDLLAHLHVLVLLLDVTRQVQTSPLHLSQMAPQRQQTEQNHQHGNEAVELGAEEGNRVHAPQHRRQRDLSVRLIRELHDTNSPNPPGRA